MGQQGVDIPPIHAAQGVVSKPIGLVHQTRWLPVSFLSPGTSPYRRKSERGWKRKRKAISLTSRYVASLVVVVIHPNIL